MDARRPTDDPHTTRMVSPGISSNGLFSTPECPQPNSVREIDLVVELEPRGREARPPLRHGNSRDAWGSASAALGAPKHAYPRRCRPRWRRRRGGPCEATIVSTVTTAGDHQPRLSRDVRSISFRSAASWSLTHPPRNKCSQENPTSAPFDRLFVGPSGLTCCVGSLPRRDLSRKHVVPFYHCTSSHHGGT